MKVSPAKSKFVLCLQQFSVFIASSRGLVSLFVQNQYRRTITGVNGLLLVRLHLLSLVWVNTSKKREEERKAIHFFYTLFLRMKYSSLCMAVHGSCFQVVSLSIVCCVTWMSVFLLRTPPLVLRERSSWEVESVEEDESEVKSLEETTQVRYTASSRL
jgi:hypothetical protein